MFRILRAIDGRASLLIPARLIYMPDAIVTPDLERAFFAGLRLPNGTFKTTTDHRLGDLNEMIAMQLAPGHVRAKDVAVSSGITTVEWYDSLISAGFTCEMTATDLQVRATLIECISGLTVLVDKAGAVMQIDVAGFAFRPDQVGVRERVIYGLPIVVATRPRVRARLTKGTRPIELVSPRLVGNVNVRVTEEDLNAPAVGEWDVVRAANILNRSYFSEPKLIAMLGHLAHAVRPGGLLVLCRTIPASGNHGSVFRRGDRGFEEVGTLGAGSEVADLVRQLKV